MSRQYIITISREYGSGGHDIGQFLADELGIRLYDRNLIGEVAQEMGMEEEELEKYDERANKRIVTRTVKEYSNSMEVILEQKEEAFLRERAESGESFLVVGRRGKEIFRDSPALISLFITADEAFRIKRIMEELDVEEDEAKTARARVDHARKAYHKRYSDHEWGESGYYDLIINSARLGVNETAVEVLHYVKARIAAMEANEGAD